MKKKIYLETAEDVLALKDTDTKIYEEPSAGYYKFVKGTLCHFNAYSGITYFNCSLDMEGELYILEEESMQEATVNDTDKLCWFWDRDYKDAELGILEEVSCDDDEVKYLSKEEYWYYHCRRLSPAEVAEITGYGVTEDGSTFYGEQFKVVGKEK